MTYRIEGADERVVPVGAVDLSVHVALPPAGVSADRPAVVFAHGFPELAYSWRHQLPAVAAAGFVAVAPDQRGYGASGRPAAVEEYDIFHLTGDLVAVLDALEVERAVFVGHDWGGFVVWQMPLLHPERVAGVASLNTPYVPRLPMRPTELFRMMGGDNHYIVWFQQPEVPDAALAAHSDEVLANLFRRGIDPTELVGRQDPSKTFVELVVGAGDLGTPLLEPDELAVFQETFRATGYTGGINWYRNFDRNWECTPEQDGARIDGIPCLMVTAAWDPVLTPAMAQGMPSVIGDLEMHEIERCGHWTQQESPAQVNAILVDWLTRRFG